MIVFSHIRNTGNAGDMASCPAQWFPFPPHQVLNYSLPMPDCETIIYGGGTMVNWLRDRELPKVQRIGWGIGSSIHGQAEPWRDPAGFRLLGVREWSAAREAEGRWAPCASCMSPLFDKAYPTKAHAVLFINASPSNKSRYPVTVGGMPTMENDRPMDEIVPFLGSGKVVVTNSYHGVYWATLLGRRVVCVPYSSKFYGFRHAPGYSCKGGLDWRLEAEAARWHPAALAVCRAATVAFYERVMELIAP